jgi:O-antigen chain-terminating methyltransferase
MFDLDPKLPKPLDPKLYDDFYRLKDYLYEKVDPRQQETITSRVPVVGPLIVAFKKLLRALLSPIINMVLLRQTYFNEKLVELLTKTLNSLVNHDYENQDNIRCLKNYAKELQQENLLLKNRLDRLLQEAGEKFDSPKMAGVIKEERDSLWDHQYLRFENRYRGLEEDIKERQGIYLPIYNDVDDILDIGCGRGEFLSLLKENGKTASGIDLNEDMIHLCQQNGLEAKKANAFDHLKTLDDESLGGIFAAHVIEHVGNENLREFVQLCVNKLKPGGILIYETPNPYSMVVSSTNFYLDLTHINPIHPEAIQFVLDSCGISKSEIKYLSPFPQEMLLKEVPLPDSQESRKAVEQINLNIEHLNRILYGYQDYAVIGKKP